MLDPLSAISLAANVVQIIDFSAQLLGEYFVEISENTAQYGLLAAILVNIAVPEAGRVISRVKHHLIGEDPKQVELFKQSFTETFTMIGVGGAIVAQIAFTGLSLDDIGQTHWTTYAAFVVSLIAGSLSVFYACTVQLRLSGFHGAEQILEWLTRPANMYGKADQSEDPGRRIPSLHAALLLVIPSQLLTLAVGAFLVGLGIYLGFLWAHHLKEIRGHNSELAVLIVYIVFSALLLLVYAIPSGMKRLESFKSGPWNLRIGVGGIAEASLEASNGAVAMHDLPAGFSDQADITTAIEALIRSQETQIRAQQHLLRALKDMQHIR